MIMNLTVSSSIEINCLLDLPKLKINKLQIARELGVDRRLIDKYMNGYTRPKKRERKSKLDNFYQIIYDLLINQNTQFFLQKSFMAISKR